MQRHVVMATPTAAADLQQQVNWLLQPLDTETQSRYYSQVLSVLE